MFIFYNAITGGGYNMKIYKSYKFRMYPNKEQEELINKTIGSSRFVKVNIKMYKKLKIKMYKKFTHLYAQIQTYLNLILICLLDDMNFH